MNSTLKNRPPLYPILVLVYSSYLCNTMNKLTTITIRQNNYERLRNLGKTGETFNDVLGRVLDQIEKDQNKK